jgi:hypothetical protein
LITEHMFGRHVAIASGLILTATPVWWSYGLFAHPITTALLLFFTGLAILCRYARVPPLIVRLGALGLFSAALMFRFDCMLLFIVVFALLWANRKLPFIELAKEFSLYLVGSVFLFLTAQRSLPAVTEGDAPKSLLTLLSQYQNLALFLPNIRSTLFILVAGFTGLLLLTVPISAWLLYRRRNYPALLLVSGFIAVNLIFWIPNPGTGARHFLMMAPAMSTSGALVVVAFFSWNKLRVHFPLLPLGGGSGGDNWPRLDERDATSQQGRLLFPVSLRMELPGRPREDRQRAAHCRSIIAIASARNSRRCPQRFHFSDRRDGEIGRSGVGHFDLGAIGTEIDRRSRRRLWRKFVHYGRAKLGRKHGSWFRRIRGL